MTQKASGSRGGRGFLRSRLANAPAPPIFPSAGRRVHEQLIDAVTMSQGAERTGKEAKTRGCNRR